MKAFKTVEELAKFGNGQIRLKELFTVGVWENGRFVKFELPESELLVLAKMVAEYLYSTKGRQNNIVKAILNNDGDYSYLECFYLEFSNTRNKAYISNSLSGEAFDFCRRKFYKTI